MIASSVAKSVARSVAKAVSDAGSGGVANPFVATPSTETPVAGVDVTWSTNAGDLGTPVSYSWDFGDGTVPVTGATPSHYFVGLGPFTVTCTVTYNDASTDTDTVVITPTAPSAVADLTLVDSYFHGNGDLTSADFDTFDAFNGGGSAVIYSVPVGGKLAATASAGFSGFASTYNCMPVWAIGNPKSDGKYYQIGAWFYFELLPASDSIIIGSDYITIPSGLILKSNGTFALTWAPSDFTGAPTIALKTWYWIGLAMGGVAGYDANTLNCKLIVKEIGQAATFHTADTFSGIYTPEANTKIGCGVKNAAGNVNFKARVSAITLHEITSATLDDAAYPNEIVPPQDENHIYQIDPVGGDDTADGIYAAWETVAHANDMMDSSHRGIISNATAATTKLTCGKGSWLTIDTSVSDFPIDTEPLYMATEAMWLKPIDGQALITFKAYGTIGAGDWAATGGYSNIYETACTVPVQTTVFGDNVCFEPVANLAALDAAAGGASWLNTGTNVLYVKTLGLTDPRVDGITYIYGKQRPSYVGDPVGYPVVSIASSDIRVSDCRIWYTAVNKGGSYAIGDWTGFSNRAYVEGCSSVYSDKHGICFTINATNSTIDVDDCEASLSWTYPFTSFMLTGSGNEHNYTGCTSGIPILLERSAVGAPVNTHGNGPGAFYMHGGGSTFDSVVFTNCVFAGSIEAESASLLIEVNGGSVQFVRSALTLDMDTVTLRDVIPINGTVTGLTVVTGNTYTTVWDMEGSLTNSTFDLRTLAAQAIGLWTLTGATTFTGNTVRFAAGQSSPIIKDSAASNIVSWNNNTYYIEAAAIFAKAFDDGGGADDYTFAQWQALGYDAASTRIDP